MICTCCNNEGVKVIIDLPAPSLTSINTIVPHNTTIYFCTFCCHLFKMEMDEIENFYSSEYKINLISESYDQIYELDEDNKPIYRNDYQAKIFLEMLASQNQKGGKVFDYGAGKGSTLKEIILQNSDLVPYAYDYDKDYQKFWDFIPKNNQMIGQIDKGCYGKMDYVVSFFVLEHVKDLHSYMENCYSLLKDKGLLFFVVPNSAVNIGDILVIDHVHHFSKSSIEFLCQLHGFEIQSYSETAYNKGITILAQKKNKEHLTSYQNIKNTLYEPPVYLLELQSCLDKIKLIELSLNSKFVVYGAGFYGSYFYTQFKRKELITAFIDSNKTMINQKRFGLPIYHPNAFEDKSIDVVLAVNPKQAQNVIQKVSFLKNRKVFTLE